MRIGLFRSQFLQRDEIFQVALQFAKRIDQPAQPRDFFDFALRALAIRPEIGRGHPRLEFR